jgi:hypothetical protein
LRDSEIVSLDNLIVICFNATVAGTELITHLVLSEKTVAGAKFAILAPTTILDYGDTCFDTSIILDLIQVILFCAGWFLFITFIVSETEFTDLFDKCKTCLGKTVTPFIEF